MKTIIAAVDFSEVTENIMATAQTLAGAFGASLYILHVEPPEPEFVGYEPGPQHVRDNVAAEVMEDHQRAHELAEAVRARGIDAQSLVIQGPTAEKVLEEAQRLNADLLIVGGHAHGKLHDFLIGSDSSSILRGAACPVLVVPRPA